jgi:uncharacterized protein YjdB
MSPVSRQRRPCTAAVAVAFCAALFIAACGAGGSDGPAAPVAPRPTALRLSAATALLEVGQREPLTATVLDQRGTPVPGFSIAWSSSAPAVATVDDNGQVTAVAAGTATVTAAATGAGGSFSGTVAVTVARAQAATLTVQPATPSVTVGQSLQLSASARSAFGVPVVDNAPSWSSLSPTIATVDQNGRVTALRAGEAVIRVQLDRADVSVSVRVRSVSVKRVRIAPPASTTLFEGNTVTLSALLLDSLDREVADAQPTWRSDNPTVASVSSQGVVTALAAGSVTISATADSASASLAFTVIAPVARVELTPDSSVLALRESRRLVAVLRAANGAPLTGRPTLWRSSAPDVATVATDGTVTATRAGRALITAEAEGRSATAVIWVSHTGPVVLVRTPPASTALPGRALSLSAIVTAGFGDVPTSYSGPVTVAVAEGDTAALIGMTTVSARQGVAVFDDIGFSRAGTYRLRVTTPNGLPALTSAVEVSNTPLNRLTVGAPTTTVMPGQPSQYRVTVPVQLGTATGQPFVGTARVTATVVRGRARILSGATADIGGTSGGALVVMTDIPSEPFELEITASGFAPATATVSAPGAPHFVFLSRSPADSVVDPGASVAFTLSIGSGIGRMQPVHSIVFDIAWPGSGLTWVEDGRLTSTATEVVNRTNVSGGVIRVSLTSTTPLPVAVPVYRLVLRGAASGAHVLRIGVLDLRGPSGEPLSFSSGAFADVRVR